ncbi:MAG: hypothetical protein Q4C63_03065 [Eubacteriales bacterium]|nr:hypothetical protein [Eubacteriales bacterium]
MKNLTRAEYQQYFDAIEREKEEERKREALTERNKNTPIIYGRSQGGSELQGFAATASIGKKNIMRSLLAKMIECPDGKIPDNLHMIEDEKEFQSQPVIQFLESIRINDKPLFDTPTTQSNYYSRTLVAFDRIAQTVMDVRSKDTVYYQYPEERTQAIYPEGLPLDPVPVPKEPPRYKRWFQRIVPSWKEEIRKYEDAVKAEEERKAWADHAEYQKKSARLAMVNNIDKRYGIPYCERAWDYDFDFEGTYAARVEAIKNGTDKIMDPLHLGVTLNMPKPAPESKVQDVRPEAAAKEEQLKTDREMSPSRVSLDDLMSASKDDSFAAEQKKEKAGRERAQTLQRPAPQADLKKPAGKVR